MVISHKFVSEENDTINKEVNETEKKKHQNVVNGWMWTCYFFLALGTICLFIFLMYGFFGAGFGTQIFSVAGLVFTVKTPWVWFSVITFFSITSICCMVESEREALKRGVPF